MMIYQATKPIILCAASVTLLACSNTPSSNASIDPLKNTKKLVTQGHTSLYKEGALQIPNTSIKLIPAGNDAIGLAKELTGLKAKQSFSESIKAAKDSVTIVSVGTQKTYEFSKDIFEGSNDFANWIREHSRPGSTQLIYNSYDHANKIIGTSWDSSRSIANSLSESGDSLSENSLNAASEINETGQESSQKTLNYSWKKGSTLATSSIERAEKTFDQGKESFVQGYIRLPDQLSKRLDNMDSTTTWQDLSQTTQDIEEWRKTTSAEYTDVLNDTRDTYFDDINESLDKSQKELNDTSQHGSLAVLKSLGWAIHGVVWQGVIKPIGKLTTGALSYVAVNGVIYPVVFVGNGVSSAAELAVKVSWNSAAMAYDVVAPTGHAALASVISSTEALGGSIAGGAIVTGGALLSGAQYAGTKVAAGSVATVGYASGKGIKYIGVPIVSSGIVVAGGLTGATVASAEAIAGGSGYIAGEAAAASANVIGSSAALATLGTGTVASTAVGAGYGVYQVSKSVVIPSSYSLSSGVVLGYASLSQIAAHSLLAVSDASYLVLSMEGANWVVYSVKGAVNSDGDISPGTVLDLENMQNQGEEFKRLPLSQEEMDALINNIPQDI